MNFQAEFHRPDTLPDPFPKWKQLILDLHAKIGNEALCSRIEVICQEWALNSGYYFKTAGDRFIFVHVLLSPKDFQ